LSKQSAVSFCNCPPPSIGDEGETRKRRQLRREPLAALTQRDT